MKDYVFSKCTSLRCFYVPEPIAHIGSGVVNGCDRLLTTVQYEYNEDDHDDVSNDHEVNQWLMQRHANFLLHQACSSTSITSQGIEGFLQEHGIERTTKVDDQQMTALHILCVNPHVTGNCIRAYLQLAPEAAEQEDSDGMTPFQRLCRNDITFLVEDRRFSSLMACMDACLPRPK